MGGGIDKIFAGWGTPIKTLMIAQIAKMAYIYENIQGDEHICRVKHAEI